MNGSIKNVAIIMDGNGRWAQSRGRPRVWGHVRGSRRVSDVVTAACELNLTSLTLYAFSTENWSRPSREIKTLFKILKKFLRRERNLIIQNNIRFQVIGNYQVLDSEIVSLIEELQETTENHTGLNLNLAVNYGGRSEIVDAVNSALRTSPSKEITEEDIEKHLYNPAVRDIDLLIRTAGDIRISNFLLWQISYAEFFFSLSQWPEFTAKEFKEIVTNTSNRERRYGGLVATDSLAIGSTKGKIN
jgi:undecaprenyl diphosphate synthase